LKELAHALEKERKKGPGAQKSPMFMPFVKEGQTPSRKTKNSHLGILGGASDWEMRVDLGKKLVFPEIVETTLRPDVVLWSSSRKKLVIVELTVPWKTRCLSAHERKREKYDDMISECCREGWAWNFPVEVGCREFPTRSAGGCMKP